MFNLPVMAGLVPAIHVFGQTVALANGLVGSTAAGRVLYRPVSAISVPRLHREDVDGRDKPGHDGEGLAGGDKPP